MSEASRGHQPYTVLQREEEADQGTGVAEAVLLGTSLPWPQRALLRFLKTRTFWGAQQGTSVGWG